jgi:hypothetical protein
MQSSPHSPSERVQGYLQDVAGALVDYIEAHGTVHLQSQRDGAPLTITFTLDDGDLYHSLLDARLARAYEAEPHSGDGRSGNGDVQYSTAEATPEPIERLPG